MDLGTLVAPFITKPSVTSIAYFLSFFLPIFFLPIFVFLFGYLSFLLFYLSFLLSRSPFLLCFLTFCSCLFYFSYFHICSCFCCNCYAKKWPSLFWRSEYQIWILIQTLWSERIRNQNVLEFWFWMVQFSNIHSVLTVQIYCCKY